MRNPFFYLLMLALLGACGSTGTMGGGNEPLAGSASADRSDTSSASASQSLLAAIEASGEKIAGELPPNSRVAIVAFESSSEALSNFIMEELTGALFDRGIEVADRQNLEFVYRELNFQMSGDVSDETAKSIGRFLGADMVITGQLIRTGGSYRYRTSAIHVERATLASVTRLTVENDREMRQLIEALNNQQTRLTSARYGVSEDTLPRTAGSFLDRGILFLRQGEYDKALSDFDMAIRFDPNMGMAYWLRARVLYANIVAAQDSQAAEERQRAFERIHADYTHAIRLIPNDARIYLERGNFNQYRFHDVAALEDYSQTLRLNPNEAAAFVGTGELYLGTALQGEWTVTRGNWTNDHSQAHARGQRGVERDLDKAIVELDQAIRIDPNYAYAYFRRGIAYSRKENYQRAVADFDRALGLSPNDPLIHFERGTAYHRMEDFNRAVADMEAAVSIHPRVQSWNSRLYEARREQTEALRPPAERWFEFTANENGVTITKYNSIGDVTIPQRINGMPVTEIGEGAFRNIRLTSVVIPNTVIIIGDSAFATNQLTSLTIPSSVRTIGVHAFSNNRIENLTISSGLTSIESYAFFRNRLAAVSIPSTVTSIGPDAFRSNQITSLTIPSGLRTIGVSAFSENPITNLVISSGLTSIEGAVFHGSQLTSITIPPSVTAIANGAFGRSNTLTRITIPTDVEVGVTAFPGGFYQAYERNNRRAGTYVLDGRAWRAE